MRRSTVVIAAGLIGLTNVSALEAQATAPIPEQPYIETVGTGTRRTPPDRANVHLIVETRAATAAGAAAQNTRTVAAVVDTLRKAGLDSAVTTSSYHVGPNYEPVPTERGEPRPRGYFARTVLRVRLTRIESVGRVIDAGLARGATGVEQVFFESSRGEEERRAALADAAASARREAEGLARALGGSLGRLIAVSTSAADGDPRRLSRLVGVGNAAMETTMISPNDIVIGAAVVTRWQFVPAP